MVIETRQGERRKLVVCTDRIEKIKVDAMVTARKSGAMERNAYTQGLSGLLGARQKVAADTGMSEPRPRPRADRHRPVDRGDEGPACPAGLIVSRSPARAGDP